jgi:MFS transporter, DHA1 family, chloramphenicol resistance protein
VNVRVFTLAAKAPNLAGAGNITGFNVGIIVGPALSAALIDNGFGLASVAWASAGLAVVGLVATGWSYSLRHEDHQDSPAPEPNARRASTAAARQQS